MMNSNILNNTDNMFTAAAKGNEQIVRQWLHCLHIQLLSRCQSPKSRSLSQTFFERSSITVCNIIDGNNQPMRY